MFKICFIICSLFIPINLFSWGNKGHSIVADIAKSRLSPNIIDSVDKYLDVLAWGKEAATWMGNKWPDRTYEFMRPWHQAFVSKNDKTYVETKEPNLVSELQFIIEALQNRQKYTPQKIGMYLKILMHLVGDLHQPLNCGYTEDHGGEDIILRRADKETTLRQMWETEIIKRKHIDEKDCLRLIKKWEPEKINVIKQTSVLDCFNESRALLPRVYHRDYNKLSGKYVAASSVIIQEQLAKAGLRLQAILEKCFVK